MNIVPTPPDRQFEIGRASELVVSVLPARKSPQAESEQGRAARDSSTRITDVLQREALMEHYAETLNTPDLQQAERRAQRAVQAYNAVEQGGKRELLADLLGVSEYA